MKILVVGAGFAGAVYARELAENGHDITVIDRRSHIGGNAYDFTDENGVRRHMYGPHLFHTSNETVVEWLAKFSAWTPYEHRVRARLSNGDHAPLPININTINAVFGVNLKTEAETRAFLKSIASPATAASNAAEHLHTQIGQTLTDLFFRPYTKKMWMLDLEDLDADVVKRIPLRFDDEDRYFPNDRFQLLPTEGYTKLFENILSHDRIAVELGTEFHKDAEHQYDHVFNSMPIDEYYDYAFGELPYRSIRFLHKTVEGRLDHPWATTNFTDSGPLTRETYWHLLPNHLVENTGRYTITQEEPCDYKDNNLERYYPVKTADGRFEKVYHRYRSLAEDKSNIDFVGRCGTYQYLDMHQVINQSLVNVRKWIEARS